MPSEQQIEVYRQHRIAQEKYVYFLLAAVGAAIALAVNQTQEAKLACSQLPLGCAVALWALSFFFGCRHLAYVESTLFANAVLLKVEAGEHSQVGIHPEHMAIASEGIRKAIESNSNRASRFAHWQFNCLLLGAISYLGWHVFEMWLRSVPIT
ncbi:MAG: hypothetical protein Q7U78_12175 [Gallionella sp.]|nr:hypothetical protein [Gallionella sp.]